MTDNRSDRTTDHIVGGAHFTYDGDNLSSIELVIYIDKPSTVVWLRHLPRMVAITSKQIS